MMPISVSALALTTSSSATSRYDGSMGMTRRSIVTTTARRQSLRLQSMQSAWKENNPEKHAPITTSPSSIDPSGSLPRTRERTLGSHYTVMGIDEAGRGPLAGPVVAAAAMVPSFVVGITDSKKITNEKHREEIYERIVTSPNVRWAVAIVDAPTIDTTNILQATLTAMTMAAQSLLQPPNPLNLSQQQQQQHQRFRNASSTIQGCYVVCGQTDASGMPIIQLSSFNDTATNINHTPYALIDGNKLPDNIPCQAEFIIKGDSKEYLIGAASILAKVTRDRLMRQYDTLYPEYNLAQHKGYPTQAHMALIKQYGASPIHRRSFAPLKHMTFDDQGRVLNKIS